MNQNLQEARRWIAQARHDADAAALNAREGYAALACFLAQQATEKALCYPNGLPGGIPHEVYTQTQAEDAISGARQVLDQVGRLLSCQDEETEL
jgi:HEPN domain-containing protein